ncbi:Predicted DNA-binding transcriptional regulator YafY, contains an HTH and WYL domains [Filimonas lacunae]|uniref:Predicted DNA-binding transcriptional regulator YafY, contains an HTH and WYL domains n=1 Tax=Filimonas lacunae TaxID=477680 RepID=A0A173MQU5_9BACT|nr:WYL domain-containing protein [Filimonas lacunae]BAV10024.1 transcriptional regulator [Filimonas lacunae]SIS82729.1 Predicted DNA-binding transcriptional regulator YafY, contains an HTH and WYL domains [Filimonas lacunae]
MSINKLALIRYKTIDDCLRNRRRKWTLDDIIEKVSEVLYDNEGIENGVSKRTIQADIQLMRSDKLGYNAPIIVMDKKYYTYEDAEYSITQTPINDADVEKMKVVVGLLKQFNGFSYFEEMSEIIARLENNLYYSTHQSRNCIQFEDNKQLRGLQHINPLYQHILHQRTLFIEYQSFKALQPRKEIYHPYLLKEYRNRWFLLAKPKRGNHLLTLALDRILNFEPAPDEKFVEYKGIDFDTYFSDLIGVTKTQKDKTYKVVLHVNKYNAPYVITKPLHASQEVLKEDETGIIIRIEVVLNFELEREILGFGECMKVLSPRLLASKIKKRIAASMDRYDAAAQTE